MTLAGGRQRQEDSELQVRPRIKNKKEKEKQKTSSTPKKAQGVHVAHAHNPSTQEIGADLLFGVSVQS